MIDAAEALVVLLCSLAFEKVTVLLARPPAS
jgi:hypothetical protein